MASDSPAVSDPIGTSSAPSTNGADEAQPSTPAQNEQQSAAQPFNPGWRFYSAFASLCVVIMAAALDATSLSVALPIIAQALNGTAIQTFWSGTSYLLTSTVFQPTFASLSYHCGRKPILLLSVLLFTVGAIVAAVAQDFTTLLAGRSVQGIGGGGIISITEILITDLVPLRERGTWFGFQSLTWAVGSVSGPIVGGAFAQGASWRWIFWINLPFCGLGFVALPIFLRLNKRPGSLASQLAAFDWAGAILLTASVTSFLMPVSWGGALFPWSSWHTLVPLLLGLAGMLGFVYLELRVAQNPLIPLRIFRPRTALINYYGTFVQGTILWCGLYYLPLYYEAVKGYGPLLVGVAMFPETFTVVPASILVGVLATRTGRYRWAIWSGWLLAVAGMGLLCLLTPDTGVPAWVLINLVAGLGLGLLFSSMNLAIQAATPQRDVGFAAATYVFLRALGTSVGVAVGGIVFENQFALRLAACPEPAGGAGALAQDAAGLVQVIRAMSVDDPRRAMIVQAYADGLRVVWAVMAGLAGSALV
ncbi:MAG: hypothetical protein LQ340_007641, partial [Diploschistes diacapsis]